MHTNSFDRPVLNEFAYRALSVTEQKYAQIEKEMLAIVFGCKRFHQYIFERQVEVQETTNHWKP